LLQELQESHSLHEESSKMAEAIHKENAQLKSNYNMLLTEMKGKEE